MKKIKKRIILLVISLFFVFTSCTSKKAEVVSGDNEKTSIIATIFPIYDITKELCKGIENVNVSLLMDSGIDLHSFSPTSKDLIDISNSKAFIYIGGESDEWVDSAFDSLSIDKEKQLNLMKELINSLKEEELKEGMEEDEEHEHEESEKEYDEHIWLSIKNTKEIAKAISKKLIKVLGTEKEQIINENCNDLIASLENLDSQYKSLIDNARLENKCMTLIFADRFPFRYLFDDYGLDYFAAFKGCSAESEASFKTVKFLADKINELNLNKIFVIDDSDKKIAETVIETSKKTDVGILTFDSMQSKTSKDIENGATYIDIMNKNLYVLEEYFK